MSVRERRILRESNAKSLEIDRLREEVRMLNAGIVGLRSRITQLNHRLSGQKVELKAATERELDWSLRMWGHTLP